MSNQQKKQPIEKELGPFIAHVAGVGFFGGLFWSLLGYFAYYLNFTKVGPALILSPWALGKWKSHWPGQIIGVIVIAFLSILIAIGYRYAFAKVKNMWAGAIFGVILWFVVFYVMHPIFPKLENMNKIGKNTIITTLSLYILYGVFVGYSISFEYAERKKMLDKQNKST